MTQSEINDAIKKIWTEKVQKKGASLSANILEGYADWVRNLVKQAAEQQAVQSKQQQPAQQPGQQGETNLPQGGAA